MRLMIAMWKPRPYVAALAVLALLLLAGGIMTGVALSSSNEALRKDIDTALALQSQLGAKDATIVALRGQVGELEGTIEGLTAAETQARVSRDAEIQRLSKLIADSGITGGELDALRSLLKVFQERYAALLVEHEELQALWSNLTPIESTGLSSPALYLNRAHDGVAVTKALCSGSMEPTITCDDMLILYKPTSLTDLDEGDVIYFRTPNLSCTGTLDGRFRLHRISNVISGSRGLLFQTKGDADLIPDECLVPSEDVLFKLLTTVRDGRLAE